MGSLGIVLIMHGKPRQRTVYKLSLKPPVAGKKKIKIIFITAPFWRKFLIHN